MEQSQVAIDQLTALLATSHDNDQMPKIPVGPKQGLDEQIDSHRRIQAHNQSQDQDEERLQWHLSYLLGHQSLRQSSIQFLYGEHPGDSSATVPGHIQQNCKRTRDETDEHPKPATKKARRRRCVRCKRDDCQGAYNS